ncbi:MAG: SIR2 family NAD-dependent protein deacylase [Planctomycetota bacterium]
MGAARRLLGAARHPVSFSGAGLSAESGIPTFRDASAGLWAKHDPMQLASPQGFAEDPQLVLEWYAWRRQAVSGAEPNPAHHALAARPDIVHVTQNVDDLLERAGAREVIHLHGTIMADRCHAACGYERPAAPAPLETDTCPRCGAPLRPAVVWFGEMLPPAAWAAAERACTTCDVLLVVGTSAVVYPAAGLIGLAKSAGAKVVIVNTESSDASDLADVELLGPAGEIVPRVLT